MKIGNLGEFSSMYHCRRFHPLFLPSFLLLVQKKRTKTCLPAGREKHGRFDAGHFSCWPLLRQIGVYSQNLIEHFQSKNKQNGMSRFCGRVYAEWVPKIILESGFGGRSLAADAEPRLSIWRGRGNVWINEYWMGEVKNALAEQSARQYEASLWRPCADRGNQDDGWKSFLANIRLSYW